MKKKVLFIINPFAGTASKDSTKRLARKYLNPDEFEVSFKYTEYAGHAITLAKEAVDKGLDIVAAVGGDGTVNEVASILCNSSTILAIIPAGSGNGFAYHIGLKRNKEVAIRAISTGKIALSDTCTVNNHFFLNVAGIGLDAQVSYYAGKDTKRGIWLYIKNTLKAAMHFKYYPMNLQLDNQNISGEFAMLTVSNGSFYGYSFSVTSEASIDDGMFDVVLVKKAPIFKYVVLGFSMLTKNFHRSKLVAFYRVKSIAATLPSPHFLHCDGEGFESSAETLQFKMLPSSLKIIIP
jgi:diacylglycerol kinase (ATP)